jgi:hypothetical protein
VSFEGSDGIVAVTEALGPIDAVADEGRGRSRQIPPAGIQCPHRRELRAQPRGSHLEQPLHSGQVLQPVLTEIDELDLFEQRGRQCADEDLAAVARGHDAGRAFSTGPTYTPSRSDASRVYRPIRTAKEFSG